MAKFLPSLRILIRSNRTHFRQIKLGLRLHSTNAEHVVRSRHNVEIPSTSLHEFVYSKTLEYSSNIALECGITGKQLTYEQVQILSARVAGSFQTKFKLDKNDCIAIILPNCPQYPLIFLGASEAGVIPTTVNPLYTAEEIVRQLKNANTKLIFTTTQNYSTVAKSVQLYGKDTPIVVIKTSNQDVTPEGAVNFDELIDPSVPKPKPVPVNPEDTLVLPYSSGTTGLVKGVQLTHKNLVSNLVQLEHKDVQLLTSATSQQQDAVIGLLPMFHIFGMTITTFHAMRCGNKIVTMPNFDPQAYLNHLSKYKPSVLYVVPPLILFLGSPAVSKDHLSSVKFVLSGGAPCGEKDAARAQEKLSTGGHVVQGYGLTETSPTVFNPQAPRYGKLASVGAALPNTCLRIVDNITKKNLPKNQVGELHVFGPQVMKGYLNNEEANRDVFDEDGWFRTGDLAYYDDDEDFYIVDRLKELIKVKGFQVAPAELEELLRSHPKIDDAAVIGITDAQSGELPRGFVVTKPGANITEDEIKTFISKNVTKYKRLEGGVTFVKQIPKSASGKILRRELKAQYL